MKQVTMLNRKIVPENREAKFSKSRNVNYSALITNFNKTRTQNGAISKKSTGSSIVDLFYLTARDVDLTRVLQLCETAWNEDKRY